MKDPIDQFRDLAENASDEGRAQYEAAINGMERSAQMGEEAMQRRIKALEEEFDHRRLIALQYARVKALRGMR